MIFSFAFNVMTLLENREYKKNLHDEAKFWPDILKKWQKIKKILCYCKILLLRFGLILILVWPQKYAWPQSHLLIKALTAAWLFFSPWIYICIFFPHEYIYIYISHIYIYIYIILEINAKLHSVLFWKYRRDTQMKYINFVIISEALRSSIAHTIQLGK